MALILFMPWTGFFSANGDSYVYASYLVNPEVSQWGPVVHLGYYGLTNLFYALLQPFGVAPTAALALFSCLSGLVAAAAFFLFAEIMLRSARKAFLAGLMLVISGFFWLHAMYGEVYIPQVCCVLIALLCLLRHRPVTGAVFFLVAISMAPTSLLILGFPLHLMSTGKISRKALAFFVFPAVLLGCAALIGRFEAVTGILGTSILHPRFFLEGHTIFYLPWYVLREAGYAVAKTFNLLSFFILFGLGFLIFRNRTLFKHILFAALPFAVYLLNLGLLTAEHLCLLFPFFCLAAAEGLSIYLAPMNRKFQYAVGAVFLILTLLGSYLIWIGPAVEEGKQLQEETGELAKQMTSETVLIAPYHYGVAYWYRHQGQKDINRLAGRPYLDVEESPGDPAVIKRLLEGQIWINRGHLTRPGMKLLLKEILRSRKEILFVDAAYAPTRLSAFFLTEKRFELINKRKAWLPGLNLDEMGVRAALIQDSTRWPVYRLSITDESRFDGESSLF